MVFGVIQFFNEENADCRLFGKHASRFDARLQKVELSNWFENYVKTQKVEHEYMNQSSSKYSFSFQLEVSRSSMQHEIKQYVGWF